MSALPPKRYWRTPLDAAEILPIRGRVSFSETRCKGCSFCVEFCPCDVLVLSDRINLKGYHLPDVVAPEACLACRLCERICPEFAVSVEELPPEEVSHAC